MATFILYNVVLAAFCLVLLSECRSIASNEENDFLKALEADGPRRGRNEITDEKDGIDKSTGPRRGRNEIHGPRRGRDEIHGPRRGRDEINGPRRGRDEINGPRRGRDEIYGPRRGREVNGPRRGRDEIDGPRRGREVETGPRRGRSEITNGNSNRQRFGREANTRNRRSIDLYHMAPRLGRSADLGYFVDDAKHRELSKLQSLDENNFGKEYYNADIGEEEDEDDSESFYGEGDDRFSRTNMVGHRRRNYDDFQFAVGDLDFKGIDEFKK